MSLTSNRAKLQRLTKDLTIKWDRTTEDWNDPMSRRFQTEFLELLQRTVVASSEAMDTMNEVLMRAQRDCE